MPERGNAELFFAILLTILAAIGLAMLGGTGFPERNGVITPLFPTPDRSKPFQHGMDAGGATVSANQSAITATAATITKPLTMTAQVAPTRPPSVQAPTSIRPNGNTPTPVRVVVSTQKRSWVYYHGPTTPVRADAFAPLALSTFPRPANDNGRGLHWFPTTYQTRAVVDRFIPELKAMKIRWLVVLQGMNDWDLVTNDYLIDRLNAEGITVVMRIDRQVGKMDWQRLGWIVARYRERGVRYIQLYNEPNVLEEWNTSDPPTPEQFIAYWIQGAEVIAANGGFPGFAPMSPQRDDSDLVFFQAALEELKRLKRFDLANMMWVSVHNYGDFDGKHFSNDGFFRYRSYDALVKAVFGGSLPMIITEGGFTNAEQMTHLIAPMYQFVTKEREPFLLAFAPWLIGNVVGGGHDARWESAAWFTGTLSQVKPRSVVEQAKGQ
ncbi:hypothetical protein ANRL3_01919 [Anaerolineae bacterium]|nr:hypothetical protein ANRL3_01919 [Anaerolineae bacterium]